MVRQTIADACCQSVSDGDAIVNDIGMAMRDVGLTFPLYITVRNSGDALDFVHDDVLHCVEVFIHRQWRGFWRTATRLLATVSDGDFSTRPQSDGSSEQHGDRWQGGATLAYDDELRRVWTAAAETPYPYGGLVRMLILTGCRLERDRQSALASSGPRQEADSRSTASA
jgi:hypothetical protein